MTRSFDLYDAAERWDCDVATAQEILFGPEGFLDLGLVASVDGNGRLYVTELGLEESWAIRSARLLPEDAEPDEEQAA